MATGHPVLYHLTDPATVLRLLILTLCAREAARRLVSCWAFADRASLPSEVDRVVVLFAGSYA